MKHKHSQFYMQSMGNNNPIGNNSFTPMNNTPDNNVSRYEFELHQKQFPSVDEQGELTRVLAQALIFFLQVLVLIV